jgi:glutamate/tyrosine decarboxylase-like PLP-dependent enzyme
MNFAFDAVTRRTLGYKLIDHINRYFSSLPDRPVQLPAEERKYRKLTETMPDFESDAAAVLDDVCQELVERGFHVPAANYFGLMNPAPTYMAVLAEALVAALNPQLASVARSQLATRIEAETVRWIGNRVGWPVPFNGTFTSGGNEANFSALALALNWKFPGVVEDGVATVGAPPVLYSSSEAHHSIDKSAGLLGLGRRALRRIPANEQAQLDPERLERQIQQDRAAGLCPFCVVATAGTTNSGAIDDIPTLADICRRYDLWLHVDGAYGVATIFSDRHRYLVNGIELADSLTVDPHKWLSMPFAAGLVLTSHPDLLEPTFSIPTPYMPKTPQREEVVDYYKLGAQWTRRMNSLKLWLTLRVHGRLAYEELIEKQIRLADDLRQWIRNSESFELGVTQVLPVVNFRVKAAGLSEAEIESLNASVVEAVTRDGQRWLSLTHVRGQSVIRAMIISYHTEKRHLDGLLRELERAGREVALPAVQ